MGTYMDIVGSIIIGGLMILSFNQFTLDRQSALLDSSNNSTAQLQLENVTSVLMSDLRKIGHYTTTQPFLQAAPKSFIALGDIDNDGAPDTIKYWWATPVLYTPNPNDSLLYRQINNGRISASDAGVVRFNLTYLQQDGTFTTTPSMVRSVLVSIQTQSRYPVDGAFPETYSEFRISPRNINK